MKLKKNETPAYILHFEARQYKSSISLLLYEYIEYNFLGTKND